MVSRPSLALGTVQWGTDYGVANRTGRPERSAVGEMLALAARAGVDQLDTARAYGESEAVIGALTRGGPRWAVTTKLAPDVVAEDAATSLARVGRSLAESRRALRRDRLDTVLLHRAEHRHAFGGLLWRRLRRERSQEQIGALGVSVGSPGEAWALLSDPEVEVLQVASNLFDQRLARGGFFARARDCGKRVQVRSIFLQGVAHLPPQALPPHLADLAPGLQRVAELAHRHQLPARQLFLAHARSLDCDRIVVGCERAEQLLEILSDWSCEAPHADILAELVNSLPAVDPQLLDPSRWGALAARIPTPRHAPVRFPAQPAA